MIEAQAFMTSVRVGALNREANRNDAVSNDREERAQHSVGADLFARVSPSYPDTAARRNITMRKSRDRLDDATSKSPEVMTSRRSSRKMKDIIYSMEGDSDFQGATAIVHTRKHGEEIYSQYEGMHRSLTLPDGYERGLFPVANEIHRTPIREASQSKQSLDSSTLNPLEDSFPYRKFGKDLQGRGPEERKFNPNPESSFLLEDRVEKHRNKLPKGTPDESNRG